MFRANGFTVPHGPGSGNGNGKPKTTRRSRSNGSRNGRGLQLKRTKELISKNGLSKVMWQVAGDPASGIPVQWVRPSRRELSRLEEACLAYGYARISRNELFGTLASQVGSVPRIPVFRDPGWNKWNDEWVFVHGGGVLGAKGVIAGVEAELCPPFDG